MRCVATQSVTLRSAHKSSRKSPRALVAAGCKSLGNLQVPKGVKREFAAQSAMVCCHHKRSLPAAPR